MNARNLQNVFCYPSLARQEQPGDESITFWLPNQAAATSDPCVPQAEPQSKMAKQLNFSEAQLRKSLYAQRHVLLGTDTNTFQNLRKQARGSMPCSLHQHFDTINIQPKCQESSLALISDWVDRSEDFRRSSSACAPGPDCPAGSA